MGVDFSETYGHNYYLGRLNTLTFPNTGTFVWSSENSYACKFVTICFSVACVLGNGFGISIIIQRKKDNGIDDDAR